MQSVCPVIFTFTLGFYWQQADNGMTQQTGSVSLMLHSDHREQLFSPLKLQYTVTFSQLQQLQGGNGLVIITIIKVVAEFP